ncbi:hypothetical protein [Halorussus salinus]|uniref:hypothetical protein n=1 Tax=Halorussus salinus TaxID=1364935 RepID=UPI001091F4D2|nr:hypothetical protein [Halorussus salinus]
MDRTLTLPNGDTVTPDDVFLYNDYPYRVAFPDDDPTGPDEESGGDAAEFHLSPLYWGGGEMDVPFREREALVEQWGEGSEGLLTEDEWEQWLDEARTDERFDDEELDALRRELPVSGGGGVVARIRRALGI